MGEGCVFIYKDGSIGCEGEHGIEGEAIQPGKWNRVTVVVKGDFGGAADPRAVETYLNGNLCASVTDSKPGGFEEVDGSYAISSESLHLFRSSKSQMMPGVHVRKVSFWPMNLSSQHIETDGSEGFSWVQAERKRSLKTTQAELTLKALYPRPPPVWVHPGLMAECGAPYVEGSPHAEDIIDSSPEPIPYC